MLFQRANRQALAEHYRPLLTKHWRWLVPTILLACVLYLLGRDPYPATIGYQELLSTTNANKCGPPTQLGGTSRLALTLQGNEKRYQESIVHREDLIARGNGMNATAFKEWNDILWDFFVPEFSCPFPMYRIGVLAEGGKWLCGLERVLHNRPNCLVYSLNHQAKPYSSFEVDMLERSPGCQIHVFDANATADVQSKWPWGQTNIDPVLLQSRVHFNQFAIANPTAMDYRSLKSTMGAFGHEWIDVLKIELGGSEFATLLSIIAESGDKPLPFGQLVLTLQTGLTDDMITVGHFSDWWLRLECAGLRPFSFEVSMSDVNNRRKETSLVYWSFMNIRGTHALVDDNLPEYP